MRHFVLRIKELYPCLGSDSANPTLTAYLPDNLDEMGWQERKRPCLIICPGGAYAMCSQREAEPVALNFLSCGYNVFILNYSVAPCRFPSQLREVAAALECVYKNADEWHCDLSKVAIMGFSAGGHLAAQYINAFDCPEIRDLFPQSRPVNAAVLCYPVITADERYSHKGSFENLLGHGIESDEERERFSCERLVSPRTPSAFIWHTAEDTSVPPMNSLLYAEALAKNGVPFSLHIYPAGRHGLATCDNQTNEPLSGAANMAHEWINEAREWLKLALGL